MKSTFTQELDKILIRVFAEVHGNPQLSVKEARKAILSLISKEIIGEMEEGGEVYENTIRH